MLTGLHEVWEDGQAFKDLHARTQALTESKASIEAARKVCDAALLMEMSQGSFRAAVE